MKAQALTEVEPVVERGSTPFIVFATILAGCIIGDVAWLLALVLQGVAQ